MEEVEDEDVGSFCQEWRLPASDFLQTWDNLFFEGDLKSRLLRYVEMGLVFSEKGIRHEIIKWNRLVLLHGPPGTGVSLSINITPMHSCD